MAEKLREIKEDKLKIFSTPLENCTIKDGKSFIMGKKAFWHNGIHFLSSESVHTVYTGQIVAYRYISNYKTLDIEIPEDIEEDYLGIYKITTPEQIEILKRYYNYIDGSYKLKSEYTVNTSDSYFAKMELYKLFNAIYSNSFLILKHAVKNLNNNTDIVFYTLYNHLRPLDDLTNQEKAKSFLYDTQLSIKKITNYYIYTSKAYSGSLTNNPYLKVYENTPIIYLRKYFSWDYNGQKCSGFIYNKDWKYCNKHIEICRPNTKEEKEKANRFKDKYFLYDNQKYDYRNISYILNDYEKVSVTPEDFKKYVTDHNEKIGLKVRYNNKDYYIYFAENKIKDIHIDIIECEESKNGFHSIEKVTFNRKNGFVLEGRNDYGSLVTKTIFPAEESDMLCPYVYAYDVTVDGKYQSSFKLPCETIISEAQQTTEEKYEYVSTNIPGLKFEGFINKKNINKKNKIVIDEKDKISSNTEILIYGSSSPNDKTLVDSVSLSTKLTLMDINVFKDNSFLENGIPVSYEKNKQKYSGYVFLKISKDEGNTIKEKIEKWFKTKDLDETVFENNFSLKLNLLKQKDSLYVDKDTLSNKITDKNTVGSNVIIGYTGYPKTYEEDSYTVKTYEKKNLHFELFTDFDIKTQLFNSLNNYNSDLIIKKETVIHYDQPTTKLVNEPIKFDGKIITSVLDDLVSTMKKGIKSSFITDFLKPKELQILEDVNEITMCYFKTTGETVELIEGESYTEIQLLGKFRNMNNQEYLRRYEFDGWNKDQKYWTVNSKKEVHIYDIKGNETETTITLYPNIKYFPCKSQDYNELNLSASDTKLRFRRCEYIYTESKTQPKVFVSTNLLQNVFVLNDIYYVGHDLQHTLKIEAKDLYLRPLAITWKSEGEKIDSGKFINQNKKLLDVEGKTWRKVSKEDDNNTFMWLKESDISNEIDTEKPIEEIIYNKWEQFFTKIDNLEQFGTYCCEEGNEEKLLDCLQIPYNPGTVNNSNISDIVGNKKSLLKPYYFSRNSEWKIDESLTNKYVEKSKMREKDVRQKRNDYSIPLILDTKKFYYNPLAFLHHLDKVALIEEFNPYKDLPYSQIVNTGYSTWIQMDDSSFNLSTKVVSNPGFAPYNPNLYGTNGKYHNYGIKNGYAPVNTLFLEKMTYADSPYPHEGIDFDGENIPATNKDKLSRTPIHSFINGKVVLKKDNGDSNFGRHIVICDFDNKLYLLGHLYDYADGIEVGTIVTPGMTIGYVGNTGNCGNAQNKALGNGSHLHISIFEFSDGFVKSLNLLTINLQETVLRKIGNGSSYNCYSNANYKVISPFDYSKERKK